VIVFRIQGKDFPLDDSVAYRDYYLMGGRAVLADVQWAAVLADVQSGRLALDDGLAGEIAILDRWVAEAPRKRHYREMARTPGTAVLSGEEIFTNRDRIRMFEFTPEFNIRYSERAWCPAKYA
jgi:hypothetical protein